MCYFYVEQGCGTFTLSKSVFLLRSARVWYFYVEQGCGTFTLSKGVVLLR